MRSGARREHTGAPAVDRIQRPAQQAARTLAMCPFVEGRIKSVKLSAAIDTIIDHGLGAPAAFIVARGNYDGTTNTPTIIESASQAGLDANNQLSVRASASCTVDLWFYQRASQAIPNGAVQSP